MKHNLPASVLNFINQKTIDQLIGSDVAFSADMEEVNRGWAADCLRENNSKYIYPENHYILVVHQGYTVISVEINGSSDPPVWIYSDGMESPQKKWGKFSDFHNSLMNGNHHNNY